MYTVPLAKKSGYASSELKTGLGAIRYLPPPPISETWTDYAKFKKIRFLKLLL